MTNRCDICVFRSKAIGALSIEEVRLLNANCTSVHFNRGDLIFKQGAFSLNVGYLKTGLAKLHMNGLNNKEQIIKLSLAPTFMGIPTSLGNRVNQYSATAIEPSSVCFIDLEVFKKLIQTNAMFSYEIIKDMATNELNHFRSCFNKTHKNCKGLLAEILLDFSNTIYKSNTFTMPLNRNEIANLANSSREMISRLLSQFHQDKIIDLQGRNVRILNAALLEKINNFG
ncbi:MAG: Crp/Fnr family transcriptional regulator [Bacteroidales bacterium]